jgi:hypothetical protein
MARRPKTKEITNAWLLKDYASWIYCAGCEKTVAYLCYVTYDMFDFSFACNCGGEGHVRIEFERDGSETVSTEALVPIKNRLCCPSDHSPLVTFVEKNLKDYRCDVICKACNTRYTAKKEQP